MTPRLRKLGLTAHIIFSVGWLGAVAGFLVLSIGGLTSQDAEMVRRGRPDACQGPRQEHYPKSASWDSNSLAMLASPSWCCS